MTDIAALRTRLLARDRLTATFVKTPHQNMVEVLGASGLDLLCLDAEHAPWDRAALDASLAVARAGGIPVVVRVPDAAPATILSALDMGAAGIVVPHVASAEAAAAVAKAARYGHGGRGFAGSTRSAGFATRPMAAILADTPPLVFAQIEEPEGVAAAPAIAATEGIDALFVGPADLAVCLGETALDAPPVRAAMAEVAAATTAAGKALATFAPGPAAVPPLAALGVSVFFLGSDHAWMLAGARAAVAGVREG